MSLNRLVLVLNASYEPIHICTARRAITLTCKGAAVVEELSAYTIRTSKLNIPVPNVIRLVRYRRVPRQNRSVSRKGIILRDGSACQYCGSVLAGQGAHHGSRHSAIAGRILHLGESGLLLLSVQQPER